jgi:hypothetical protein
MAMAADDDYGVTMVEFARLAGMSDSSIRYHAAHGHIKRLPNGKWNPADAAPLAAARQQKVVGADPGNAKLLKARVLGGAVKTRRLALTVQETQARTIERRSLEADVFSQCEEVTARVRGWPQRYAGQLAADLEADPSTTTAILTEFAAIALGELGDLRAESQRYISRGVTNV